MPARFASLFSMFKLSPGQLSNHGRHIVVLVAAVLLFASVAVFVRSTWNEELSNDVIAFTALFVVTALVLIGFARSKKDSGS